MDSNARTNISSVLQKQKGVYAYEAQGPAYVEAPRKSILHSAGPVHYQSTTLPPRTDYITTMPPQTDYISTTLPANPTDYKFYSEQPVNQYNPSTMIYQSY